MYDRVCLDLSLNDLFLHINLFSENRVHKSNKKETLTAFIRERSDAKEAGDIRK